MGLIEAAIIIAFLWFGLYVIHLILTSCLVQPYLNLVHHFGIQIRPFFIGIYTTRLNYCLNHIIHTNKSWIKSWFNFGLIVTLITIPISFYLVIQSLIGRLFENEQRQSYSSLQLILPGVNLPLSEIGYYMIALLVSSAFHEFGHFSAAIREGLRVSRVGCLVFAIIPIAFVELSEDALSRLSARARMRVIASGIWHNIALGFVLSLILLSNPYTLSFFYDSGEAITAVAIKSSFSTTESAGIHKGDVITWVDSQCPVYDKKAWINCLSNINSSPNLGYCLSSEFILKEEIISDTSDCCEESSESSLCFKDNDNEHKHCLHVRPILSSHSNFCNQSSNCPNNYRCFSPIPEKEGFKLIEIKRKNKPSVIFWGLPFEIYEKVTVMDYVPKYSWLPLNIIYCHETLLKYIIAFSLALAVINSIPCTLLDGKWLFKCLIENYFHSRFSSKNIRTIEMVVNMIGNILITAFILSSFINLFNNNLIL